ncbi:hypothetical protein H109_07370 [Trichophyton interdigitale MR816]|uniref:NADP-dependent oxidoreductase domain-containing protein n=1 Tax=Trichophyton interdigitale (strain MR816) TaxID=1215338 RepID=A0A059IYX5_TRIIM|nr:hypothetical protein H109_07370 [Trichophyton interdigitale MR816]
MSASDIVQELLAMATLAPKPTRTTSQDAGNEAEVGNAVRKSGIPRENFFLVIKVSMRWPSAGGQSYSKIIESVNKIGGMGGYVNLLLIPSLANNIQKRVELWSTLQDVLRTGRTRHIGVGNYTLATFLQMGMYSGIGLPHVVQLELRPWNQQRELVQHLQHYGVVIQVCYWLSSDEKTLDKGLVPLAKRYHKTPLQILIRYSLQKGWVPLSSSHDLMGIRSNIDVFDFVLTEEDMHILSCWRMTACGNVFLDRYSLFVFS